MSSGSSEGALLATPRELQSAADASPDRPRRTRRGANTTRGGTPDMTSRCAEADHAGARPNLHRCA